MRATRYTPREQWPGWLREAETDGARVEVAPGGCVIWHGGTWRGGDWRGGTWRGGDWLGGTWRGGAWRGGTWWGGTWRGGDWCGGDWRGGTWRGGTWWGGTWRGGTWRGGDWLGGTWRGGEWLDPRIDRLEYMAALCGIVFDADGYAIAWRTTTRDGRGRYTPYFVQPEGEYYEENVAPAGAGTCKPGIHVTNQAVALTYFGVDPDTQLWRVRFHRRDLLDCDGEKARIRGGHFERVPWTWFHPERLEV